MGRAYLAQRGCSVLNSAQLHGWFVGEDSGWRESRLNARAEATLRPVGHRIAPREPKLGNDAGKRLGDAQPAVSADGTRPTILKVVGLSGRPRNLGQIEYEAKICDGGIHDAESISS